MKIGLFFASMSGNTEAIADMILERLSAESCEVEMKDILSITSASELLAFDLVFLGMYTWGDGDVPDECLDIIEELEELQLEGKPFALFGSGDTSYPEFCGALDKLKDLIYTQGGVTVGEPLRIEFNPTKADEEDIAAFVTRALSVAKQIQ